jgi:hypothetical protein
VFVDVDVDVDSGRKARVQTGHRTSMTECMTLVPAKQDFRQAHFPAVLNSLIVMTHQIRKADAVTTDASRMLATSCVLLRGVADVS